MYEAGLSLSNECKPIEASPTLCYSLTRLERKRERTECRRRQYRHFRMVKPNVRVVHVEKSCIKLECMQFLFLFVEEKKSEKKKNIEWRYTIGVVIKPLDTSAAIATGSRWALNDRKRIYTSNTYTHVHTGHQLSPGRQQILVYIHIKNEESSVVCIIRHEIGESSLRNFFSHLTRPAIAHFRFIFQQCQAKHVHTPKTKIKKENFFQMKCREFICWMFLSSHFICM